ncbi:glycosyl hydrolase family 28-related protein [Planctomycetota bacterium]
MKRILLILLLCSVADGVPEYPQWRIVKTKYPTADTVVVGLSVLEFGAKGDGQQDCTQAFQQALDCMKSAGGGTVFVPEGRYVFEGTLRIPVSVTLRGEWAAPTKVHPGVRGTVLMVYAGRGQTEGAPFITVDYCAGVKDLSIWYPDQDAEKIVPYPYCLIQKGGNNATFENLTLVNPYQGIRIGPGGNELHYMHNVYGTPLKLGIRYDSTTDIGRLENIHFSPRYWCQSGLAKAPPSGSDFAAWLLAHGTAIHMERSDWEYVAYVTIDGYQCGYLMTQGARGAANAQFYGLDIRSCQTAIEVQETNPYGMVFTNCVFYGRDYGFRIGQPFKAAILLRDCEIAAEQALDSRGTGCFIIQNSRVKNGHIHMTGGVLALTASQLQDPATQITLGPKVQGATLVGNHYAQDPPRIQSKMSPDKLKWVDHAVTLDPLLAFDGNQTQVTRPALAVLYVVTDPRWGANGEDQQDDTHALQQALDRAGKQGGGIVFIPAGNYILRGSLSVPSGVELRGIHDVPHHTRGDGSLLHVYPGAGQDPTITVQARGGLRGLAFNYPDQTIEDVKPYPYLIQGKGDDLYVVHVNSANAYRFLDLKSYPCHRHYVDYLSGSPLRMGIAMGGGSVQGEVRNTQFNPHYWSRCDKRNPFFRNSPGGGVSRGTGKMLWTYQKENLDAMWVGHCREELLFQNFVFGSLYGIHFVEQGGRGPEDCVIHGHGTDGSKVGVYFERGSGRIDLINSELVAMSSDDKVAIKVGPDFQATARLVNTMVWGTPSILAQVENGTLQLEGLHAFRHGQGIELQQGEMTAVNVHFYEPGSHLSLTGTSTQATLIGTITKNPLTVNSKHVLQVTEIPNLVMRGNVSKD